MDARRTGRARGRCPAPIKSRRTVPDGDERHCERKSGPAADSLKQRVSSPPARDHLLRVGHHRQRNENSKPEGGGKGAARLFWYSPSKRPRREAPEAFIEPVAVGRALCFAGQWRLRA